MQFHVMIACFAKLDVNPSILFIIFIDQPVLAVLTENELVIWLENLDTWKLSKPDVSSGTSPQMEFEDPGQKYIRCVSKCTCMHVHKNYYNMILMV